MAGIVNKVFLMGGQPGGDGGIARRRGGHVGTMGLGVSVAYKTRDGEGGEEATGVDCEGWGRTAEVRSQYLCKGRPVFIEGRLKLDQWDDRETGKKRSKLKVVIDNFQFVDSKGGDGGGQPAPETAGARSDGGGTDHPPVDESDIPF